MVVSTPTIEALATAEIWELARQVIIETPILADERRQIENDFGVSLDDLSGITDLPMDALGSLQKRMIDIVHRRLDAMRNQLHQRICVVFDYCERKKTGGWRYSEYLAAVLDIFVTGGGAALAMLALKTEFLDKLCKCKQ